jgi:hypothetical protein
VSIYEAIPNHVPLKCRYPHERRKRIKNVYLIRRTSRRGPSFSVSLGASLFRAKFGLNGVTALSSRTMAYYKNECPYV